MTISQQERRRLVYLSPVALASFAQRPHHFVQWFHNRFDADVLWIEPGPSRFPKWSDWNRLRSAKTMRSLGPSWAESEWLVRHQFPTLPLEPVVWGRQLNRLLRKPYFSALDAFVNKNTWFVFGKPCDLALELCDRFPMNPTVFDVMDSMSAFSQGLASQWMAAAENELVKKCRWILTSSTALEAKFAKHSPKVRKAMNGLSTPPSGSTPSLNVRKTCVLGYVGLMASWFDWDAIIRLAQLNSGSEIRLIGPCECVVPANLPDNVRLLPPIAHDSVYPAMQEFNVGLIPFKVNKLTDFVDPVKYYEYRALGLPVLSSRFGEMRQRGPQDGVFFLEDIQNPSSLSACIDLSANNSVSARFCQEHHWDARFNAVDFFCCPL